LGNIGEGLDDVEVIENNIESIRQTWIKQQSVKLYGGAMQRGIQDEDSGFDPQVPDNFLQTREWYYIYELQNSHYLSVLRWLGNALDCESHIKKKLIIDTGRPRFDSVGSPSGLMWTPHSAIS